MNQIMGQELLHIPICTLALMGNLRTKLVLIRLLSLAMESLSFTTSRVLYSALNFSYHRSDESTSVSIH